MTNPTETIIATLKAIENVRSVDTDEEGSLIVTVWAGYNADGSVFDAETEALSDAVDAAIGDGHRFIAGLSDGTDGPADPRMVETWIYSVA